MKYLKPISAAVCLAMLLTSLTLAADSLASKRVIVQADSPAQLQQALDEIGGQIIGSISKSRTYLVTMPKSASTDDPVLLLKGRSGIQLINPEAVYNLPEVNQISIGFPDEEDPQLNSGISPADYYGQPGVYSTGIDSAQMLFDGSGIVVAIIDNGIDFSHPLFADANVIDGYDFVDDDSIPAEEVGPLQSHGTFVSGLIRLTAPGATLMPIRVFNEYGDGYEWDVIQGIYWAINHGANVINMSFCTYYPGRTLETAINDALNAGIVLLASVGNDSTSVAAYPAAYSGVIAVSAMDTLEYKASFSSYGTHVDLCAPGVAIYSSFSGEHPWGTWSGTSFAVALVTGSVALTLQSHPEFAGQAMQNYLRSTARTALAWGNINVPNSYYGYGCLDALAAVLPSSIAGDLNGSGTRDMADLTLLLRFIDGTSSNLKTATDMGTLKINAVAADVNGDGIVDQADVDATVRYMFEQNRPGYRMARVQ